MGRISEQRVQILERQSADLHERLTAIELQLAPAQAPAWPAPTGLPAASTAATPATAPAAPAPPAAASRA
ncbi:MAG TPA: hypothetical protein VGV90_03385, partial [Solirubrobacteraceae bacterium]|nr:hypothetical protein [Solirubrobacteraceae bacterium]